MISMMSCRSRLLSLLLPASVFSYGQELLPDTLHRAAQLKEVTIHSFRINDSLLNVPAAMGILPAKELQSNNSTDISTAINRVAGIYMQSSGMTTNRITVRGIGARTPYGTNKIRAFYGNIPLTSGNSETTIEDIDLDDLGQAEIIKGPYSSLYGAGLGGAVLLTPKMEEHKGNSAQVNSVYGSYGLSKKTFTYGLGKKTTALHISYHQLETEGWRDNAAYNREGITIAGELFRKPSRKLAYFMNHTYLKAYIPSSIDKAAFDHNPRAAAPAWAASKGYKQYKSVLGGLSYDFMLTDNIGNATSVFLNYRDNNEPRPFDILRQYTFARGARTQFSGNFRFSGIRATFNAGLEYFMDDYAGGTFENRYVENDGNGSLEGNRLTGTGQKRLFYNIFTQLRILLSAQFELQAGFNINKTRFELQNTFPETESDRQQYSYAAIYSPQASLLYKPGKEHMLYISVSRGFSLPSVEETLTAGGTVNTSIRPESGYNFEAGGKFYLAGKKLYAEIAAYSMQIRDLLVARRIGDDQYTGVNAGKTLHQGIELLLSGNWAISRLLTISPFVSGSAGHYRFRSFRDSGNDYSGNALTGVPANKVNAGIGIDITGLTITADYQFVDRIPLNDSNTAYANAYRIVNLKTGYRFSIADGLNANVAAGINNAFNAHYASMVLINATAPDNGAPRYYYPGLPVNYYGMLSFAYAF